MNKHEKILKYIAKNRLGFFYLYGDTTCGVYGDAPTYIVITQTQGRRQVEITKVAFDTYENAIESQFNKFDISAKFAVGKELLPKLQMFWEITNTIPLFPIQEHPAFVSILNKGKMNAVLCFSLRYLLGNE